MLCLHAVHCPVTQRCVPGSQPSVLGQRDHLAIVIHPSAVWLMDNTWLIMADTALGSVLGSGRPFSHSNTAQYPGVGETI